MAHRAAFRRQAMDKDHAIFTARNVKDSKFGEALLKNHACENRQLSAELTRLERELRRKHMHFAQERKRFISAKLEQPEPTILVERPPSPDVFRRNLYSRDSDPYKTHTGEPGFMRPTRSKVKTPTTIPVIDAFTVHTKKKVNLWERGRVSPAFRSRIMPSTPLSTEEHEELQRGSLWHQKPGAAAQAVPSTTPQSQVLVAVKKRRSRRSKKGILRALPEATGLVTMSSSSPSPDPDEGEPEEPTFITELPGRRQHRSAASPRVRRVSFAPEVQPRASTSHFPRGSDPVLRRQTKRAPGRKNVPGSTALCQSDGDKIGGVAKGNGEERCSTADESDESGDSAPGMNCSTGNSEVGKQNAKAVTGTFGVQPLPAPHLAEKAGAEREVKPGGLPVGFEDKPSVDKEERDNAAWESSAMSQEGTVDGAGQAPGTGSNSERLLQLLVDSNE